MRGDISKKLATLAQNPYTKEMIDQLVFNETEMNEQKICQNDSEKDEQSQIECYESKMQDVVRSLRDGASVIKQLSDKSKKADVIKQIKTANDSGLICLDYYEVE